MIFPEKANILPPVTDGVRVTAIIAHPLCKITENLVY